MPCIPASLLYTQDELFGFRNNYQIERERQDLGFHSWMDATRVAKERDKQRGLVQGQILLRERGNRRRRRIIIYNIFQLLMQIYAPIFFHSFVRTTTSKHKNTKYVVRGKVYTPPIPPRRLDVNSSSVTAPTSSQVLID